MPQILKSANPNGQIEVKSHYTTGDIAHLMGVAHSTAARLIDQGEIRGIWLPTKRRQRRITHGALVAFVRQRPDFKYMLERLNGYDPGGDFPESDEPRPPARPLARQLPGARSTRGRPGAARFPGRIPIRRGTWLLSSGSHAGPSTRSWPPRSSRGSRLPTRDPGCRPPGNGESCTGPSSPGCSGIHATITPWAASRVASRAVMPGPAEQAKPMPSTARAGRSTIAPPERSPWSPQDLQAGGGTPGKPGAVDSSVVPNLLTDASHRKPAWTSTPIHWRTSAE